VCSAAGAANAKFVRAARRKLQHGSHLQPTEGNQGRAPPQLSSVRLASAATLARWAFARAKRRLFQQGSMSFRPRAIHQIGRAGAQAMKKDNDNAERREPLERSIPLGPYKCSGRRIIRGHGPGQDSFPTVFIGPRVVVLVSNSAALLDSNLRAGFAKINAYINEIREIADDFDAGCPQRHCLCALPIDVGAIAGWACAFPLANLVQSGSRQCWLQQFFGRSKLRPSVERDRR